MFLMNHTAHQTLMRTCLAIIEGSYTLLSQYTSGHISFRGLISRKDNYGRTPFFWVAARGHRDVVELLLDQGARINSKDRSKLIALHRVSTA